jgi:lysophospholipase L1-like esterase
MTFTLLNTLRKTLRRVRTALWLLSFALCAGCNGAGGIVVPEYHDVEGHVVVVIGDSIASHLTVATFLEASPQFDFLDLFPESPLEDPTVRLINTALGGNSIGMIERRFGRDCLSWRPEIAIINGGTNDIDAGNVSQNSFLGSWMRILDACEQHGARAIVLGIVPATDFSNAQMRERDRWNAALKAETERHPGFLYVNADPYVGAHRPDGDAGNLWDIDEKYDKLDGIHFTQEGYVRIALAILDALANSPTG